MMFLFAGHSAGLLSKNFVKQSFTKFLESQLHGSRRKSYLSAPFFFFFTLWMPCGRTLIHAQSTLWIAPQNLRFTLWNSGYWMSAYKERWRQNAVEFKWHSFKRLSHYLKCSPPQIVKETIGVGVNEKAVLRFYQTALSFTSISIFPWWTKSRPFRHFYGNSIFALFYKFIISRVLLTAGFCQKNYF